MEIDVFVCASGIPAHIKKMMGIMPIIMPIIKKFLPMVTEIWVWTDGRTGGWMVGQTPKTDY